MAAALDPLCKRLGGVLCAAWLAVAATPAQADDLIAVSQIDTLYIVTFAHADVGFNAPPSVMALNNHGRTVTALDLADAHPEFHWTIETTHQLQDFTEIASASDMNRLQDALDRGQISIGAGYLNLHSGLVGEEQLNRLPYRGADLLELYGYQPKVALLDDVPGRTWAIPRVFEDAGVPYALLAANNSLGGKPDIPLMDRPFWWEGKDGSRVLAWPTYDDAAYMEGWWAWGLGSVAGAEDKLPGILLDFESNGYPYNALMVPYASDNNEPFDTLHEVVAEWNATYDRPQLVLGPPELFFDHLLNTYGDVFPTYAGDASGFWEDVSTTAPVSTAAVRRARSRLPAIEALHALGSVTEGSSVPQDELWIAWERSLRLDEHSNAGAGWPGLITAGEIWQENLEFLDMAQEAASVTATLAEESADLLAPQRVPLGEAGLVLFNPLGTAFEGTVDVVFDGPQDETLSLLDPDTQAPVPWRWLDAERTQASVQVEVPARGWRTLSLGVGPAASTPTWISDSSLETGTATLGLDSGSGTVTTWTDGTNQWAAPTVHHAFGGLEVAAHGLEFWGLYDAVPFTGRSTEVEDGDPALFRRIRALNGVGEVVAEYRAYPDGKRLDATIWLDREVLPEVPYSDHSDHYQTAFPIALSTPTTLYLDGPAGWYSPATDSLPGASMSHFGLSTGARLEGADGRWVSISSLDSPLLNLGEMDGAPSTVIEEDEVALGFKLLRHHTEALSSDLGEVSVDVEAGTLARVPYHFILRVGEAAQTPPDREVLRHDLSPPLVALVQEGTGEEPPSKGTFLTVEGAHVVAIKKGRLDPDALILRLRAPEQPSTVTVHHPDLPQTAWRTDGVERPTTLLDVVDGELTLELGAHEVATLQLSDFMGPQGAPDLPEGQDTGTPAPDPEDPTDAPGAPAYDGGCGCTSNGSTPSWSLVWLLLLGIRGRRTQA